MTNEITESKSSSNSGFLKKELNFANLLSASRPLLAALANSFGLENPFVYSGLMGVAYSTDALDGMAARKFGSGKWGGFVDIVADHATEAIMYSYLANQELIPRWIPPVVIGRALITDVIRFAHLLKKDSDTKMDVLRLGGRFTEKIVTSKTIRTSYALLKTAIPFSAALSPWLTEPLAIGGAVTSLVRGIPVIFYRNNLSLFRKSNP